MPVSTGSQEAKQNLLGRAVSFCSIVARVQTRKRMSTLLKQQQQKSIKSNKLLWMFGFFLTALLLPAFIHWIRPFSNITVSSQRLPARIGGDLLPCMCVCANKRPWDNDRHQALIRLSCWESKREKYWKGERERELITEDRCQAMAGIGGRMAQERVEEEEGGRRHGWRERGNRSKTWRTKDREWEEH